jgi:hypothetical protein
MAQNLQIRSNLSGDWKMLEGRIIFSEFTFMVTNIFLIFQHLTDLLFRIEYLVEYLISWNKNTDDRTRTFLAAHSIEVAGGESSCECTVEALPSPLIHHLLLVYGNGLLLYRVI